MQYFALQNLIETVPAHIVAQFSQRWFEFDIIVPTFHPIVQYRFRQLQTPNSTWA